MELDEIDRLLLHPDPRERRMALKLGGVRGPHLVRAFQDEDPEVQDLALRHPALDAHALLGLMQLPGREHLQLAALAHPAVGRHHVEALYHTHKGRPLSDKLAVLRAVAHHPALDADMVQRMVADGHGHYVVDNPRTPVAVLQHLIESHLSDPLDAEKRHLARRAVRHPSAPPALVERAFKNGPMDVRIAVAGSQHLPEALAHDTITRGQLPAHDHEALLRLVIVQNPKASQRHLGQASKDRNPVVRSAARAKLGVARKFEQDHLKWLGEQLAKTVKPKDLRPILEASTSRGRSLVDHRPDLDAHPPEHAADAQAYHQAVLGNPAPVGRVPARVSGRTSKVLYQLPGHHPTHANVRFMVKPYHEDTVPGLEAYGTHPHRGWAEMTNQALYHAAGIGDLHQRVHVAEHNMGPEHPREPAVVVRMEPGMFPLHSLAPVPSDFKEPAKEQARQIGVMDFLANNNDRHNMNMLASERGERLMAIDHGLNYQYVLPERDQFRNYVNDRAIGDVAGQLRGDEPEDERLREWNDTLGWWEAVSPRVKEVMARRLQQIRDPDVRRHIERNFLARAQWLDDRARFGLDKFGSGWYRDPVRVYQPGELTEDERAEARLRRRARRR